MTLESHKLLHRRRLAAVAAVAAVLTAAGVTTGSIASAAGSPVLTSLTYTSTGAGGGLRLPVGVAASNGTVYVSNSSVNVVAALASGTTTTVTGSLTDYGEHGDGGQAASATLYHPGGLSVDAKGNLYIADSGDNVIREVTTNGVIRKIGGTGFPGLGYAGAYPFGYPASLSPLDYSQDVAVDAQGNVFVADTYNNRVVQLTPQGQVFAVAGTGIAGYAGDGLLGAFAQLNQPSGVALDAKGNLYIADSSNSVIRRVDARTGIITTVAGNFAADKASNGLGGFSGDGGPATKARLNDPQGVAVDGAGDLFIADTFNNAIREVTPAGVISTVVNSATAGGGAPAAGGETNNVAPTASRLSGPYGVAVDPVTDNLYIADTHNSRIAQVTNLAQPGSAAGPTAPAHF